MSETITFVRSAEGSFVPEEFKDSLVRVGYWDLEKVLPGIRLLGMTELRVDDRELCCSWFVCVSTSGDVIAVAQPMGAYVDKFHISADHLFVKGWTKLEVISNVYKEAEQ